MFLKSIFWGSPGKYEVFGISTSFHRSEDDPHGQALSLKGAALISSIALQCVNSRVFQVVSFGYLHVWVHEMGHAVADRIFFKERVEISIDTRACAGGVVERTVFIPGMPLPVRQENKGWKNVVVLAAGPMANVFFSSCQLIAAVALRHFCWPAALGLGVGAVIWISGELLYMALSAMGTPGDFRAIAQQGPLALALSTAALVSECALGIFLAVSFL